MTIYACNGGRTAHDYKKVGQHKRCMAPPWGSLPEGCVQATDYYDVYCCEVCGHTKLCFASRAYVYGEAPPSPEGVPIRFGPGVRGQ